jgi:hypothetical protein
MVKAESPPRECDCEEANTGINSEGSLDPQDNLWLCPVLVLASAYV